MSEVTSSRVLNTNMQEINDIQREIETYTKKIEHEKINKRLANERYQKQLNSFLALQGKPTIKTKEEKEEEKKQKEKEKYEKEQQALNNKDQGKNRKFNINRLYQKNEKSGTTEVSSKEVSKNEVELDKVKIFVKIYLVDK